VNIKKSQIGASKGNKVWCSAFTLPLRILWNLPYLERNMHWLG